MAQIHISESNLVIENKTFTSSHYAREKMDDGTNRGTFRSYSVLVDGDNIRFINCVLRTVQAPARRSGRRLRSILTGTVFLLKTAFSRDIRTPCFSLPCPTRK